MVGRACEAPVVTVVRPGVVCVVPVTSTVPTVAPVSPFTPVIVETVAVCGLAVIRHAVSRHRKRRVRLADVIIDRPALVVVVGRACEAPRIIVVRPGVGVRRVGHVNRAHRGSGLPVHTGNRRDGRRVRVAVIRHAVSRHRKRRVRLADVIINRPALVVVVGRACEAPRIIVVGAGVGVRRAGHVNRAHRGSGLPVHTGNRRDGRRVRVAVIRHAVSRHRKRRVRLADVIIDRPALVVVVGRACEAPRIIVVRPGIGVRRAGHVNRAHRGSGLPVHTGNRRDGRRVRVAVIRHAVSRHRKRRVRLADVIIDRPALVVVVGRACEGPRIIVVGAGSWCASCRSRQPRPPWLRSRRSHR